MTNPPLKPWESNNPNRPRPAPHGHSRAPASATAKRRNADDYKTATLEQRPTMLRAIACAKWQDAYKGRMTVLYEVIDGAYALALRGEVDADDLETILQTIKDELDARKAAAAMTNAAQAKKVNLAKTSAVRLGGEQTMPREKKPEVFSVPGMPSVPVEPPVTGGPFGTKPETSDNIDDYLKKEWYIDENLKIFEFSYEDGAPMEAELSNCMGPFKTRQGAEAELQKIQVRKTPADNKPTCLNEWALDPKKLTAYQERIEYIASEAGVSMKEARGWGKD